MIDTVAIFRENYISTIQLEVHAIHNSIKIKGSNFDKNSATLGVIIFAEQYNVTIPRLCEMVILVGKGSCQPGVNTVGKKYPNNQIHANLAILCNNISYYTEVELEPALT